MFPFPPCKCTACPAVISATSNAEQVEGMLIICTSCAHLMVAGRGLKLRNLTREEAEIVRKHPNFPKIRRRQEEIIDSMQLIG